MRPSNIDDRMEIDGLNGMAHNEEIMEKVNYWRVMTACRQI
jgi:hypothetical protein